MRQAFIHLKHFLHELMWPTSFQMVQVYEIVFLLHRSLIYRTSMHKWNTVVAQLDGVHTCVPYVTKAVSYGKWQCMPYETAANKNKDSWTPIDEDKYSNSMRSWKFKWGISILHTCHVSEASISNDDQTKKMKSHSLRTNTTSNSCIEIH